MINGPHLYYLLIYPIELLQNSINLDTMFSNDEERKGRYHIMDFRQLEAFIATVDHQSFSAAAEALYLSQPTISSYIHSLERELNTQLIRRTTKKFEVTVNGQQLYEYAVALLRLQQKAITELSNTGVKELHIGTSSVPGQCILPGLLAGYRETSPSVNFRITNGDSLDIIQKVEAGTLIWVSWACAPSPSTVSSNPSQRMNWSLLPPTPPISGKNTAPSSLCS